MVVWGAEQGLSPCPNILQCQLKWTQLNLTVEFQAQNSQSMEYMKTLQYTVWPQGTSVFGIKSHIFKYVLVDQIKIIW